MGSSISLKQAWTPPLASVSPSLAILLRTHEQISYPGMKIITKLKIIWELVILEAQRTEWNTIKNKVLKFRAC